MDLITAIIFIAIAAIAFLLIGITVGKSLDKKRSTASSSIEVHQMQRMKQNVDENGIEHIYIAAMPSSMGLLCCGIVFAVIAIGLFVLSIRKVNDIYVANVQETVFSAASAVASVVCFVGVKLVKTYGKALR